MKSYAYENLLLIMDIAQKKTLMLCGDDRRESWCFNIARQVADLLCMFLSFL